MGKKNDTIKDSPASIYEVYQQIQHDYLPAGMVYPWATHQAELSELYQKGDIGGTSSSASSRKRKEKLLSRIRTTLSERSNFDTDTIESRLRQIEQHLEDPGLLENFEFFDIPSSDFMLQFYFAVWDLRIAELMIYTHNYGKDLKGVVRKVYPDDVWYKMSRLEGMNINERKKSQNVVDFINSHDIKRAVSFGGGNIPERCYDLPRDLQLTVFDDGPVSPLEELFLDAKQRRNINYIHERLSEAPKHHELLGTQQLVWMHGVSMYLDEKEHHETTGAILCGMSLLEPGGFMKYDYLVWTESIRRVIRTQNWPYDPRNPMVIFPDADSAIKQGRETIAAVNASLAGKAFVEILDPEITFAEPWGVTSVRFTLKKHV